MFGFKKTTKFNLASMFPVRFFETEGEGGPGGGSGMDDEGGGVAVEMSDVFADGDIPKELADLALKNDPELRQDYEGKKARKAAGEKAGKEKKAAKAPIVEPEGEQAEEAPAAKKGSEPGAGAAEGEAEPEFDTLAFEDDIIPGLKGEDMKKLGPAGVAALAEFYEKHTDVSTKSSEAQARLDALLADPIVKARDDMMKTGKTQYNIRQISPLERQSAIDLIKVNLVKSLDLTEEEGAKAAEIAFEQLRAGFETITKQAAEDTIHSRLIEEDARRKTNETISKARGVFHNLGKFNKSLALKETDPNKFWTTINENGKDVQVLNDKHPEAEQFKKTILPVMQAMAKAGISYDQVVKMTEEFGEEAVYSFAAKKLGLPVVINASKEINAQITSEKRKLLSRFLKSSASEELPAGGSNTHAEKKGKENIIDGIDVIRLANDGDYYDTVLRQKPGDEKWMERVSELEAKGRRLRSKPK